MSTRSSRSGGVTQTQRKSKHKRKPAAPATEWALRVVLVVNLALIPLALMAMGEESGPVANFKYLVVGFAAAAAAYGVNRFALEKLAPLHAIGFSMAGVVAVLGILLTGFGTSLGSFTGITYHSVEAKIYQEAGQDLSEFIGAANEAALVAARVGPGVEAVAQDIDRTSACEILSSCLSRKGNGGAGPMSRALDGAAGEAFGIAKALEAGKAERDDLLDDLNRLNADYHDMLADSNVPMNKRRAAVQAIHAEARQVASALMEAMPMGLVRTYADKLRGGASVAGDRNGSRILSAYLSGHGEAIAAQLDELPEAALVTPNFPGRPGMIEVLKYLPSYIAIAAIVLVGELCLPITMYIMTWLRLVWRLEQDEDLAKTGAHDDGNHNAGTHNSHALDDGFGDLLHRPPHTHPQAHGDIDPKSNGGSR